MSTRDSITLKSSPTRSQDPAPTITQKDHPFAEWQYAFITVAGL